MSKGYAMTGWRLGYIAAPQFVAKACAKIQGQVTSGATAFGQKAAATALLSEPTAPHAMRDTFLKRRDMMLSELRKIEGLKVNTPQGAFYIFPDCSAFYGKSYNGIKIDNSSDLATAILQEVHVALVAGSAFGAPNCFRISYAASDETLMEACRRLQKFFGGMS